MKNPLLLTLIILMIVPACRRDIVEPATSLPHHPSSARYVFYGQSVNPANSENPYDSIGILHNLSMNALAHAALIDHSLAVNYYKTTMGDLLSQYGLDSSHFIDSFPAINSEMLTSESYEGNFPSYYQSLHLRGKITSLQRYYMLRLDSVLSSLPDVLADEEGSIVNTCNAMFTKIRNLESDILLDAGLQQNNAEKAVLMCASIARYSIAYFADVHVYSNNAWRSYIVPPVLPSGTEDPEPGVIDEAYWSIFGADWMRVSKADAGGALGGISACGAAAYFIEFTWPVIGAAALGGASGGSASELYNQLVNGSAVIIWVCC